MRLAYFHAAWCGVCHQKAPLVERLAAELGLPLERWDLDDEAGRAESERRRIRTVPTLALIHGERVPFRLIGRMIEPENVHRLVAQFRGTTSGAEPAEP